MNLDNGKIQVIIGPMFSGKTTELMRRLKRYQFANHKVIAIKHASDDRYDSKNVMSHDFQSLEALSCMNLKFVLDNEDMSQYSVIGIDEGQFFPDLVEFCEMMATQYGKIVIVAGLDATFQREGFDNVLQLIPLSESVVKLDAICQVCFQSASFTKRTAPESQTKLVGGADMYKAVCRTCYFKDFD